MERARHFVNVADFGLGPATSEHTPRGNRRFGPAAFLWGALVAIAGYTPVPVRVEIDDVLAYEGPSGIVAVANGHRFGGGMRVAPKARLDDGLFDVVILGPVSRRALATDLLPRVYRGAHLRHAAIHLGRGARVTVAAAVPFPLELDGEVVGVAPARFELLPGALRVLAPA
jgi:diacylglycerol kinase (ATP)